MFEKGAPSHFHMRRLCFLKFFKVCDLNTDNFVQQYVSCRLLNKFTLLFGIWITVWCILYNLTQVFLYTNSPLQWVTIILRGKFATVYQCEKHSNKELFAAKIIQTKSPKNMEESLNEVRRFQSNHDLILLIRNLKKIYRLTRLVSGLRNYYIFIFRDMSWQSKYMMVFKHMT